ncbi:MAG: DUF72 domain-containing protein [Spirochaetales bacterium]
MNPSSCDVRIGTSGFDYPEWRGVLYPENLPREQFLSFYARQFSTVELNFSYYRMPQEGQIEGMLKRAGSGLDFSIKAHESLTHKVDPSNWKEAVAEYRRSIHPLFRSGKLCAVLLQFPYSFHYDADRRRYLDSLLRELFDLPLVVEFRNNAWHIPRVWEALQTRQVGFCATDMPNLTGLPEAEEVVTAPVAYLRFHGRNRETWWGSDAAARFDYLYTEEELRPWVPKIIRMAQKAHRFRIYFNNHRRGQAAVNARMLQRLLPRDVFRSVGGENRIG